MNKLTELANKYNSDKGDSYELSNGFTIYYEPLFEPLKDSKVNLLEIGLALHNKTSSLKMWYDYFSAANIYGFDIKSNLKKFENDRTKIYRGNQGNRIDLENAIRDFGCRNFDIIIEDGSHFWWDQQMNLGYLFQFVSSGGLYIMEDVSIPNIKHPSVKNDPTYHMIQEYFNRREIHSGVILENEKKHLEENLKEVSIGISKNKDCLTVMFRKK